MPEEHKKIIDMARVKFTEEIDLEIKAVENELVEIKSSLKELCQLFGHDAYRIDLRDNYYQCKCCGEIMSVKEYVNDFWQSLYKGIVPYDYEKDPKIL